MSILMFLIIIFLVVFLRKVPPNRVAVIFRSGKHLKTVQANMSYFFNPFTDTAKLIDITPKNFVRDIQAKTRDNKYIKINIKYTYSVIDPLKVVSIKDFHILAENNVKKIITDAVSKKTSDDILKNSIGTLKILDSINFELNKYGLSAKNLKLEPNLSSVASASKKTNNKFEKVPCVHIDDEEKFTESWTVDYSGKDSVSENAIKTYELPNFSNNPIKEHHSIYSITMNTLANEDSNVDPIQDA